MATALVHDAGCHRSRRRRVGGRTGSATAEASTPEVPGAEAQTKPVRSNKATPADKCTPGAGSKQAHTIELLKRPEGATVERVAAATGSQLQKNSRPISGALKNKAPAVGPGRSANMHSLLKRPGYWLYLPHNLEAGPLLAEHRLSPADLEHALAGKSALQAPRSAPVLEIS